MRHSPPKPLARPIILYCVLLVAPFNAGCSCIYTAAERERTLPRPVDPGTIQAVLKSTPGVKDVSGPDPAGSGRLFFVFPVRRDVYHRFRLDNDLYGHVVHKEGGRELRLHAYAVNSRPDEDTRRRARQHLTRVEDRLLEADRQAPKRP